MGWFGPRGNCGCCLQGCDCLDGLTEARRFTGTPTVKVVISDVLDEFEYQQTTYFSFPLAYRDTYKFSGVSSIAGTYFFELLKTESGCIDLINNSSETQTIGSVTIEVTRQIINGTTCATSGMASTTTEIRDIDLIVQSRADYTDPVPPGTACPHIVAQIFMSLTVAGFSGVGMAAHSSTSCPLDYAVEESLGRCHETIYQFVNEGRIRTNQNLLTSTDCGSVASVVIDWGSFVVTVEDL